MLIGKRGTIPKGKFAMAAVCSRLAVLFCLFFFAASIIEAATPTSVQFTAASSDTVSASWVLDDPGAQYPLVALSLVSDFSTTVSSGTMALGAQATTYLSLNPNTTYYFKVKVSVESDASYSATISTITRIETPTDMTFEVSTAAIVALAVGAPGFTNLGEGLSATNVAIDETYAGWHTGANTWTTKANIPTSRSCLSAAAVGGKIYAIGASNTITGNKNEEYDPVANTWTTKANIPTPRGCLATAVVSGKIYAIGGGWGGGTGDENEEYDPLTNTWSTKADMPTYRSYLVAAAVGGKIYAMGGWGAVVPINKNEEYNPETDTWSTKAVLPTARRQLCAATLDGKIYAVGGIGAATTGKNEEYDPANGVDGTWITKTDMPTARYDLAAAVTGGKIYALGGYFGTQKENEEYDPVTDIWVTKADMPTARGVLAGAAVGGKIYTLQTAINEEYDPGIAQRFTGLIPNTEYDFKAKARNMAGTETAESVIVSTYTLAYSSGPASFPGIYPSSITVAWSTGSALGGYNGPGATYFVQASNLANFSTIAGSSQTANIFATVEGLYPPTTFFFRIKAMNSIGVWNNYAIIGSKANGSSAPGNPIISAVYQSSITVSYGAVADVDGYVIEASTKSDFSVILYSSSTGNNLLETLIVQDMELNATYYMRAGSLIGQATDYANTDPPTATLPIETPTDIVFEEITFSTITASAYAATPGFSNLHSGESATNIAIEEAYAGWHTGGNAWLTKAVIPTARIYLAAAAVGGKIYAIGGHTASNKNEEYDPAANEWMTKADLPTVRYHLAVAAVGGKIYAIGGYNGTQKENEEYDPIADTWDTKAVMPTARYRLSAAAVGGKIYAIGGWGGTNINEEYDPATDTWATKADMPTAREYLAAAAVGGKVYVIGGGGGTNKNEEYDPANGANGTWTTKTDMPTGRYNLAGAAVGGKIYAIGGYGGTQKENEEYDPLTNTWKIKAVMPTARSGLAAVAVGGKIYAVGGTNKNEEYDPGVTQKFTPLAPNTEYSFKAKARNVAGTETAPCVEVSTYTLVYSSGPASFPGIYPSSITVTWSTGTPLIGYNGPGATYLVQTSPYSDFSAVANSSQTLNIYATMSGSMNPNTLYYFRVKAANALNIWNDYTVIGSTYTATVKPGKPVLSTDTFKGVYFSSITIAWLANGNPDYTEYRVQASTTEADYTGALYGPYVGPSGWLTVTAPNISTTVVSLTGCVTYYFRVQARSLSFEETEFEELGSTRTAMYFECGLRMYDGTQVVRLICGCQPKYCDPPASPLRIGKDGIVYTLPLVDPVAANASKLRVRDPDGNTKALRKN